MTLIRLNSPYATGSLTKNYPSLTWLTRCIFSIVSASDHIRVIRKHIPLFPRKKLGNIYHINIDKKHWVNFLAHHKVIKNF